MKKIIIILFFATMFISCNRDKIEQEVWDPVNEDKIFATWVYYNGHIIKGYFIELDSLTKEKIIEDREKGERLLKNIKEGKKLN